MKRKPTKPTGTTGSLRIAVGPQGASGEFQKLQFPRTKEDIEQFLVNGFLKAATERKLLPPAVITASQNEQDNFDFDLKIGQRRKSLELMEVAPLENVAGSYEASPATYGQYDFAKDIFDKVLKKSERYRTSTGEGLMLLLYVTDWRFVLSETVVKLLRFWSAHQSHSFEGIYWYSPTAPDYGVAELIYPTAKKDWKTFDPEAYRDKVVINLGPAKWQVF